MMATMSPMPRHALWALCLCGAALLAGCDRAPPHPIAHAQLHIAADGQLLLDQQSVALDDLTATLARRTHDQPTLMVEIHASPQVDMAQVRAVSQAIEAAHARLSFTNEFSASAPRP